MASIFKMRQDYAEKRPRNTFDLSFQNNLTMEFGKLYPVFCQEVVPGDSFRIKPSFGLRFMPLVFPIQTKMNANLHFFYVRNRNLWKDWPDFIGDTKQNLVMPFLSPSVAKKIAKTRGLGDYFGLPTTLVGNYGSYWLSGVKDSHYVIGDDDDFGVRACNYWMLGWQLGQSLGALGRYTQAAVEGLESQPSPQGVISSPITSDIKVAEDGHKYLVCTCKGLTSDAFNFSRVGFSGAIKMVILWRAADGINSDGDGDYRIVAFQNFGNHGLSGDLEGITTASGFVSVDGDMAATDYAHYDSVNNTLTIRLDYMDRAHKAAFVASGSDNANIGDTIATSSSFEEVLEKCKNLYGVLDYRIGFMCADYDVPDPPEGSVGIDSSFSDAGVRTINPVYEGILTMNADVVQADVVDVADGADTLNPFATGDLKISALPFRAYESIYNAFYRNQQNDPFILDGQKEYNKFITNNEGGEDSTPYDFFYRNWELDFLTSATQTPQAGEVTPLVGVSAAGKFTFQNQDGSTYTVTPIVGEDGNTLTGIDSYEGTPENNSGIHRLMDLISYGISINDFRNVNALQRWLETNLRRGFRYRDQIKSHFDVDVEYKELDMPEFIGGMSEPVMVNQISQMVDNSQNGESGSFVDQLGSYAGQASVMSESNHAITHYCDEHGYIIGIMCVTPVPNYSQLLPKHFLKRSVLDYYFPEFGHIGNQPITYDQVCPLQAFPTSVVDPTDPESRKLTDVFGYQRAWYEYISNVDEVHGEFRKSLQGFLINRVFDHAPQLGHDFLFVDPEQVNDVFSVTESSDKILGQIYFNVSAQRPIPKFAIPRLE